MLRSESTLQERQVGRLRHARGRGEGRRLAREERAERHDARRSPRGEALGGLVVPPRLATWRLVRMRPPASHEEARAEVVDGVDAAARGVGSAPPLRRPRVPRCRPCTRRGRPCVVEGVRALDQAHARTVLADDALARGARSRGPRAARGWRSARTGAPPPARSSPRPGARTDPPRSAGPPPGGPRARGAPS